MDTSVQLTNIYQILLDKYGGQGWWPVTPIGGCRGEKPITPIYGIKSHNEKQKLEIIIGALLTQNTSWKNVEKAIIEMNKKDLIDINKILKIDHDELAQTIKSSGYFNQKAKSLKHIAEFLKKTSLRKLEKIELETARQLLLNIKGIGNETADSILLYALDKQIFVIDAYTKRIFSRLGFVNPDAEYEEVQKMFMDNLPRDTNMFNEYHALLVELGKNHCKTKPVCEGCPIKESCAHKNI